MSEQPVPTIDVSRALTESERAALDRACRDHGFFLLVGHGMDALMERMWQQGAAFFSQDRTIKRKVMRTADLALGYYDRELTKRRRDQKEVFDFVGVREPDQNRWPQQPEGFRDVMVAFFEAASDLAELALDLVLEVAGVPADERTSLHGNPRTSNVRLNYYPVQDPLAPEEAGELAPLGEMALGHHTDPGLITLLLQDATGGLQCHSRAHGWIDVPPNPGAIVVNLGDVMQVWTNDQYRAAIHRVTPMAGKDRYSTPYFLNPKPDAVIGPVAALCAAEPARFRQFPWREFISGRMDDNYSDTGAEDIQIDHYRVTAAG